MGLNESEAGPHSIYNATLSVQYIHSFWFSLSMLLAPIMGPTGVGPTNNIEIMFTMTMELAGAAVAGTVVPSAVPSIC